MISCQLFKRAFYTGVSGRCFCDAMRCLEQAFKAYVLHGCFMVTADMLNGCFTRMIYADVSCGCSGCSGHSSERFIWTFHASCLLLQVMCDRGEGVARAVATAIAIGFPPSEKMPKVPPSEKMAKWKLDKSFQNDKTRA